MKHHPFIQHEPTGDIHERRVRMASRIHDNLTVQQMAQRARRWFVSIGFVSMALVGGLSSAADISYVYDHLGRVLAVIDPATDTAIYSYDGVGNLTGITRQPSSTMAILQFTPAGGPVGTTVTITINAAAIPVAIGRAGQNARYTFSGTASQAITVRITGNTLGNVNVTLYNPSGGAQASWSGAGASFNNSSPITLATTGTYTLTVNPTTTATGSLNLQVTNP